jgi:hypothetical protein
MFPILLLDFPLLEGESVMEGITQSETQPVRRPRTPKERRALWKEVQKIWRKRSTDAQEALTKMREEWEREFPEFKRQ